MASLKTIKNNYDVLTKAERFALYQQAIHRRDTSEMDAIISASPKKPYDVMDFFFLCDEIFRIDTLNLLQRLSHYTMIDFFMNAAVKTEDRKKSDSYGDSVGLSAYLYTIETDAWQIVCDELGFDANCHRELAAELCFAVQIMDMKDNFIRELAFDEDEANLFLKKSAKRLKQSEIFEIKTLDYLVKFYRESVEYT